MRIKTVYIAILLMLFATQIAQAKTKKSKSEDSKNTTKISLMGGSKELQENINASLPSRKPSCDASKEEIDNFQATVERYLVKAAKGLGYYSSTFQLNPHKAADCWVLDVKISSGVAVHIRQLDVKITGEGKQEEALQKILATPMYQTGEQLKQDKYSSYKSSLASAVRSLGYFDAKFTEHEITVNPKTHTADITLHLETGKRYRYGKITMKQDILDPDYVKRFVQIKEGEPYSSSDLSKQQIYLQTTGYYSDVIIHSSKSKADDYTVPVDIKLTPRKRSAYEFKLGYGTDTGLRAGAKLERRWTGKKGRKLQHEIKLSEKESSLESRYIVPLHHPQTENVFYNIKLSEEIADDIHSKSAEIGTQYTRKNAGGFQQTAFLKYLKDYTKIDGEDEFDTNYLLLGARIDKTKRNDSLYPTKGYRLSLDIQGAHDSLFSTQNVLRVEANAKYINPVGSGKVISQLNLGIVESQDFDLLPQSLRFFAGGRDSVRGYGYQSLGERNSAGKNIGGKNLFTASLEYNHPLADSWSAATFVDTGNAFHNWNIQDPLKVGAGVGVRWKSPVGPVSVDIAWPKDNTSDPHLHLSIGPEL